jgi:hypothetical protein
MVWIDSRGVHILKNKHRINVLYYEWIKIIEYHLTDWGEASQIEVAINRVS